MKHVRGRLDTLLAERILVLDGAYGTAIQGRGLTDADYRGERFRGHPRDVNGDPDVLNLTRPDVVEDIHRSYLFAGADIVTTNTFTSTSISQADYGLEDAVYDMNVAGAQIARRATDAFGADKFVAGSVGPTNQTLSLSPHVNDPAYRTLTFDDACASYAEQIRGLVDGGVDLILIETIFDTLNAKAAIAAAKEVTPETPLMISVTITDRSCRTRSAATTSGRRRRPSTCASSPRAVSATCSGGVAERRPTTSAPSRTSSTACRLAASRRPRGSRRSADSSRSRSRRTPASSSSASARTSRGRPGSAV